ncbi:MAG: pyridine nucleotide-disulfide oxidoreductase, partial [Pseudomonadota bacterium]
TIRWDKNFLKIIRLLLERRQNFAMLGGVRFGSTITIEKAWELGFDHIALCMGAGKPTVLEIPNGLARGVRTASDFLMSLQLTGAAKKDSIANLQMRLPILVIGGGLTAIDTTTESLAYYPIQVEKFLARYEILSAKIGEDAVRANWNEEEKEIAAEFIEHAKALRKELAKSNPRIDLLLEEWGGAKMVYRKRLIDAPSYRLNHEEVEKALEESIGIVENLEPVAIEVDKYGHACAVNFKSANNNITNIKARTVLIAAGTSPNTVLEREFPDSIKLHGKYFQAIDEDGNVVLPERSSKPKIANVLMTQEKDGRAISFFGDLHPSFAGNVVKAMGSAKQGYPVISRILAKRSNAAKFDKDDFLQKINQQLRPIVHEINRLTHNIVEVVIKAPLAASQFEPGQFYRLQNFEANSLVISGEWLVASEKNKKLITKHQPPTTSHYPLTTKLAMEGLALTGAWVDKGQGLLSTIVLEMGGSSNLCAHLKKGEPVILMGPTGTPTEIVENKTVMLVGGGLGNAVLFSIGKAMRAKGSKVLYFAGYKKAADRYKVEEIEKAADVIVWACDEKSDFKPERPQDKVFTGNIVEAIKAYSEGKLGEITINTKDVEHIIAIGSDRMMAAVAFARHNALKDCLKSEHLAIGSINSPMQCMMKEICAQCLQEHIDPISGEKTYVYSCFNQDQQLDKVSFDFLNNRLKQNSLNEKLTTKWIEYIFLANNMGLQ